MNVGNALAAIIGPLAIGALTRNMEGGWRKFYVRLIFMFLPKFRILMLLQWIEMALWGVCGLGILGGYQPPTRHTRLDHLTFWQKLSHLDLVGFGLITSGLSLFLVGLNLGGGLYGWENARVLATLVLGLVILFLFGLYEWKGTKSGILHHDFFRRGENGAARCFTICMVLIFIEGALVFAYVIFYPIL